VPDGFDGKILLRTLRDQYGVVLAGGQDKLEGKIFRIGHMGWVEESQIDDVLNALAGTLNSVRPGARAHG
jgi:aspartate aminotransferase-like enzyme